MAEDGVAVAEPKSGGARKAGSRKTDPAEEATAPAVDAGGGEADVAAKQSEPTTDSSAPLVEAQAPAADDEAGGAADERAEEGAEEGAEEEAAQESAEAGGDGVGETNVSAALEAATEPAEPARATPGADETPAPARRRRRRRRGGRGRGQAAPSDGDAGPSKEAQSPSAPPPAARAARGGRTVVLLDFGGLQRSLGGASGLDPAELFSRLDGELGKLVLRRVYADAGESGLDRAALHRSGAEVVDAPAGGEERGCSAAVRIVVDALELCYTKRSVNTVVLVASSVQMLPLIAKLQENGQTVIGLGGADGNTQVRAQCDRFIDLSN